MVPHPLSSAYADPDQEAQAVSAWLRERHQEGLAPHEIGLFVRSTAELDRATRAATGSGLP